MTKSPAATPLPPLSDDSGMAALGDVEVGQVDRVGRRAVDHLGRRALDVDRLAGAGEVERLGDVAAEVLDAERAVAVGRVDEQDAVARVVDAGLDAVGQGVDGVDHVADGAGFVADAS